MVLDKFNFRIKVGDRVITTNTAIGGSGALLEVLEIMSENQIKVKYVQIFPPNQLIVVQSSVHK